MVIQKNRLTPHPTHHIPHHKLDYKPGTSLPADTVNWLALLPAKIAASSSRCEVHLSRTCGGDHISLFSTTWIQPLSDVPPLALMTCSTPRGTFTWEEQTELHLGGQRKKKTHSMPSPLFFVGMPRILQSLSEEHGLTSWELSLL